jgi:hypothetical protein
MITTWDRYPGENINTVFMGLIGRTVNVERYQLQANALSLFSNALQLSLFIFAIVAFCNKLQQSWYSETNNILLNLIDNI